MITDLYPTKIKGEMLMNYSPAGRQVNGMICQMKDFPVAITPLPADPVVAMAYVPFQTDTTTFPEMQALACGTLFPCLSKPFKGRGA